MADAPGCELGSPRVKAPACSLMRAGGGRPVGRSSEEG